MSLKTAKIFIKSSLMQNNNHIVIITIQYLSHYSYQISTAPVFDLSIFMSSIYVSYDFIFYLLSQYHSKCGTTPCSLLSVNAIILHWKQGS